MVKNMEEKQMINGGDVLVKCLLEENVKYMFGIIGGQFLNMFDAIYRWGREKGIETIMFRHEQAAAHAADAWARLTNTPGVCFGTVGPGATDLVPGVGAAWSDNIPVITIVPQVNSKYDDSFTLQGNLDQMTLFKLLVFIFAHIFQQYHLTLLLYHLSFFLNCHLFHLIF